MAVGSQGLVIGGGWRDDTSVNSLKMCDVHPSLRAALSALYPPQPALSVLREAGALEREPLGRERLSREALSRPLSRGLSLEASLSRLS